MEETEPNNNYENEFNSLNMETPSEEPVETYEKQEDPLSEEVIEEVPIIIPVPEEIIGEPKVEEVIVPESNKVSVPLPVMGNGKPYHKPIGVANKTYDRLKGYRDDNGLKSFTRCIDDLLDLVSEYMSGRIVK